MPDALERARLAADRLRAFDAERAELMRVRDAAIIAARREGATWVQIQEATGLTVGAVKKVFDRYR